MINSISAMSPEQRIADLKRELRIYGDHKMNCVSRIWFELKLRGYRLEARPDCDCGWLEVLYAACENNWCGDHLCPCQDGDACHYIDYPGSPAMTFTGCKCEVCLGAACGGEE